MRALVVVAVLSLCGVASGARAEVFIEEATTKVVRPFWEPGSGPAEAVLHAARRDWEAFQVVIQATDGPLEDVRAHLTDLTDGAGHVIGAAQAELYLEYYVHIDKPSPCDSFLSQDCQGIDIYQRKTGDYPDPLIPFHNPYSDAHEPVAIPFDVAAGAYQTVFVDLFVPPDAVPGIYGGELVVEAGESELARVPVTVHVYEVTIPLERSMGASYGFGPDRVFNYHGGPDGPDEATRRRILDNYDQEVHRHRMALRRYNEKVDFQFDADGTLLPVDFSAFDAFMGPRLEGDFFADGAGIHQVDLAMFKPGTSTMGMTDEEYVQAAKAMIEHLDLKGWRERFYLYSSDEPWLPKHMQNGAIDGIKHVVELLRESSDLWQGMVLVTGPWLPALDGYIDIWCPVTPMYGTNYWPEKTWPGPEKYAQLMAQGQELWFYVCNANYPPNLGYDLDTRVGYEPRLAKWGAWYEGATGFLFWRMTHWDDQDPWNVVGFWEKFGEEFTRNGDGILLYPGDHDGQIVGAGSPAGVAMDGPVVSYRMKQIRDGMEDWELLLLAEKLGARDYARAQVARAYRSFGAPLYEPLDMADPPWTLDEAVLLEARRDLLAKLQYLSHPDRYDDPDAPPGPEPVVEAVEAVDGGGMADVSSDSDIGAAPTGKTSGCATTTDEGGAWPLALLLLVLAGLATARRRCW